MVALLVESVIMLNVVIYMPISTKISYIQEYSQNCSNLLQTNGQLYQYCHKQYALSSRIQTPSTTQFHANFVYLYTTAVQKLIHNLPSFSLFGLTKRIQLQNSKISVIVPQDLSQSSLLCFSCDVTAKTSDFTFVASGQNVSGAVLSPLKIFQLNKSFVQFRLNGVNIAGLILNASKITITLNQCNISGYVDQHSVSGSIICFVFEQVYLVVNNLRICANVQDFGHGSVSQTGTIIATCIICRDGTSAYGLCQKNFKFGKVEDNKFVCPRPFIFDGKGCSCQEGVVVNESTCVNILDSVNLLKSKQIEINITTVNLSNKTKEHETTTRILNASQMKMKLEILNLYQLSNQTQNIIISNSSKLKNCILQNITNIESNMQMNSSVLDKRIFDNITILSDSVSMLAITSLALKQNIISLNLTLNAQKNITQFLTHNITLLNQTLISSDQVFQQQKFFINNLSVIVKCLNNLDQQNIHDPCYMIDTNDFSCSQKVYQTSFDLSVVTHQVIDSRNFSNNYVFSTAITNSFIDVFDNVYSASVNSLFQFQSTFTNLKIQFGIQTLNSGSFISTQSTLITINQMNIVSRFGSQLIGNTNSLLNILSNSPTGATINNILVNLSFSYSNGNITLINNINGLFQISRYQVLGDYNSNLTVSMIGINVQSATISINQVSFKPNTYNVGNGSSYLFGSSVSAVSTFEISNFAVIIGNRSNFVLLGSIQTTQSNYYIFGGIIAYVNSQSSFNIKNIILDSYLKFSTNYLNFSGFLVGYVYSSANKIAIRNVCLQQNMTSTTIEIRFFGLVGDNYGNISIYNALVIFTVKSAKFYYFGIVGYQYENSICAEVVNVVTSVRVTSSGGGYVGSVFGYEGARNCLIQNVSVTKGKVSGSNSIGGIIGDYYNNVTMVSSSVKNMSVSGSNSVGGMIGYQYYLSTNVTVVDSSVQNANISGSNSVGGVLGTCITRLYLTNTQIKFVRISSSSNFGIVVGFNNCGTLLIITSTAASNFVNGKIITECASLSSTWSVSGC
ncbi:T9SS_type A sorting domain-containing protein [Hexamita inflata]|uniref:T9SS type A sorting domain-containing protein n=1 Tax=Hexamita inflata TaxID=28002 RepID=A0AA86RE48_9EUKA|nr:T9SS type A sorting domain-containing protein [Hexamita inflata]